MTDKLSEAQLCAEFRTWLEGLGWTVYPEVDTWDLVVLPPPFWSSPPKTWSTSATHLEDLASRVNLRVAVPQEQLGVQAKLQANVDVLYQAVRRARTGPRTRAVLVRNASSEFYEVANRLGIGVFAREERRRVYGRNSAWKRCDNGFMFHGTPARHDDDPLWLPPVVPDLVAGGPSPRQLTAWRVKAIGLCKKLRDQGYLTSVDFKQAKVDMKRWLQTGWIENTCGTVGGYHPDRPPSPEGRLRMYVMGPAPLPDVGWEAVSKQLDTQLQACESPEST